MPIGYYFEIEVRHALPAMSIADQAKLLRFTLQYSILLAAMGGLGILLYLYALGLR